MNGRHVTFRRLGLDFDQGQMCTSRNGYCNHYGGRDGFGPEKARVAGKAEVDPRLEETDAAFSASQSEPISVTRLSGADDGGPHAGALELHLECPREAFEAPFGCDVSGGTGTRGSDCLRGHEHDVTAAPLDHRPGDEPGQVLCSLRG